MTVVERTVIEDIAFEVRRRASGFGTIPDLRNYLEVVVRPDLAVREEMVMDLERGIVAGLMTREDDRYLKWRRERDLLRAALARGERHLREPRKDGRHGN